MVENTFIDNWYHFLNKDKKHLSLIDDNNSFTREDVETLSGKVYSYLKKNNIGKEDPIMLKMTRSAKVFVAALGVLKADAIYIIVDRNLSSKRIGFIEGNSKAKLILDDELFEKITNEEDYLQGYDEADKHDGAFIVYTSGSTGKPKGVLHERGNIDLSFESVKHTFETDKEKARFALICPLQFVAASLLFNIYLNCGACLYIADNNKIKNVPFLIRSLIKNRISEAFFTPDLLKIADKVLPRSLKIVYMGGAPCNDVFSKKRTLYNAYVSSESGYVMDIYKLDKAESPTAIGKADNGYLRIENGELVAKNLYTRGYIDESLNEGVFKDGEYHTGDLGKKENGYFYVTGRATEMMKINGNRVEPHEIERIFRKKFDLECVVKQEKENTLSLFYVSRNEISTSEINRVLGEYLPEYMYISHSKRLDRFPFMETGKIDKAALKSDDLTNKEYIAPKTQFEKKLCKAIQRQLRVKKVSMNDDFFEIGGDSLSIISIVSSLKDDNFDAKYFYEGRTIREICDIYHANMNSKDETITLELEARNKLIPLSFPSDLFYQMWVNSPENTAPILSNSVCLGKFFSVNRFCKILNEYLENSSTFKTRIVLNENGVPCFKYAPELFKEVEVKKLQEREIESYISSFVKPFDLLNELPYKFEVIKTEKHRYLLFAIHHSLTDGEGINLMIRDIIKLYFNLPTGTNYFFSFLQSRQDLLASQKYLDSKAEVDNRIHSKDWNIQIGDSTKEEMIVDTYLNTGIELKKLNNFLKEKKMSRGALFSGALALAKAKTNEKNDVIVTSFFANRSGIKNHGGVRLNLGLTFLEFDKNMSYSNLINMFKKEYDNSSKYVYSYFPEPIFNVTDWNCNDLNDMYADADKFSFLFKLLNVRKDQVRKGTDGVRAFYFYNLNGYLHAWLHVDRKFLSKELQERHYNYVIEAIKRIIEEDETLIKDYIN